MEKRARGRPHGESNKLGRTETATIRLTPQLRYLAELAARVQRRTTSSFIEWSIEKALDLVVLDEGTNRASTVGEAAFLLWDPDEADRFALLALRHPELLTYKEQVLWKLIKESPGLWHRAYQDQGRWEIAVTFENLHFQRLRDTWETLKKVAAGEEDKHALASLFGDEGVQQPAGSDAHKVVSHTASKRLRSQREPGEQPANNHTST